MKTAGEKDLGEVLCVNNPVNVTSTDGRNDSNLLPTKVYRRRWLMLALFTLYTAMGTFQWVQYSIVTNIITRYYGVSSLAVDWTSMCFMAYYMVCIFPATYLIDRCGLRWANIIGCGLTCLGSWIKVFSVSPDRFYVTFIGQSFVAVTQAIVVTIPGRLSAQWFHADEISTATSLSIFGNQVGIALSFRITPLIVKNHENLEDIGAGLSDLFWSVAVIVTVVFLLVLILFENDPKLPPSATRALQKLNESEVGESYLEPVKRLLTNRDYLFLCNSYGLGIGVVNAASTLLSQVYVAHFENGEEDAGSIGLAMIFSGMIGVVCLGLIVDKTHKYKETTVIVYFCSLCGQICFSTFVCLEMKWMVYLSAIFLGYFMVGYMALGYEMCAEYTYPESEALTAGILNVANNIYGIALVLITGRLMEVYGDVPVHVGLCAALLIGLIMTILTKDVQRRQDAKNSARYTGVKQSEIEDERNEPEKK